MLQVSLLFKEYPGVICLFTNYENIYNIFFERTTSNCKNFEVTDIQSMKQ